MVTQLGTADWAGQDFICSYPVSQPVPGKSDGGRQVYKFCADMVIHLAGIGHVVVPETFEWDGASVPRLFWRLFPSRGSSDPAAGMHDFLYATEMFPRWLCDSIFQRILVLTQEARWKRWMMYAAVRGFGGAVWKKHTVYGVKEARNLAPYQRYHPMREALFVQSGH